jgi:dihydroorotase
MYDTNFKMNPPLRAAADRQAVLEGVADGTLEILSSDHAPHCDFQKEVEFDSAPFGITGFDTELPLSLMQLVGRGYLTLGQMIEKFTVNPAKLLRLPAKGHLSVGADGDVTVFDPSSEWIYDRFASLSKSKNSPFHQWPMKGRAVATVVRGKLVWNL